MISVWLRVIRVRFLVASIIAVSVGLAITWWHTGNISIFDAILTMCGVLALHASVDLLNDYWDFKRGIDTTTHRTKMSGGSAFFQKSTKACSSLCSWHCFLIIGTALAYILCTDGIVIGYSSLCSISIYFTHQM
jgi:1,4-dihydroxy-2-naphthoate octaprenyltransferase